VVRSIRTALLPRGSVVKLEAVPSEGWTFGGWAMGATGKTPSIDVVMDAPRTVQATFLSAANLIVNGDFATGVSGWTPSAWSPDGSASGTASVVDGSLVYEVVNGGTETWNVQLFQTAVPFVKGMTYTLSFDASASAAREIQVYANQGSFSEAVALGTTTKTFTYVFVSDSTESGKLSFDIGGAATSGTSMSLDNVSIKASISGSGVSSRKLEKRDLFQMGRDLVLNRAGTLVLSDARGRVVLRRELRSAGRVDLSALPRGVYVASFEGSNSMVRRLD